MLSNIHPPPALFCLLDSIRLSRHDSKVCAEISQSFQIKSELVDKHSPTKVLFRVMLKAVEKLKAFKISSIKSAVDSDVMVIAGRIGKQSFSSSRIISLWSQASSNSLLPLLEHARLSSWERKWSVLMLVLFKIDSAHLGSLRYKERQHAKQRRRCMCC